MAAMTLAQARDQVRLWSRLTTVDIATPDLDYFINAAERDVILSLYGINPMMSSVLDIINVPAQTRTYPLSTANLTNLGAGRSVQNVACLSVMVNTVDPARYRVSMTSHAIELTGSGEKLDRAPHDATTVRALFDGYNLRFYPMQSSVLVLEIIYNRNPVVQTTPTGALLSECLAAAWILDKLIVYRAAADLRASRGQDAKWLSDRIKEEEKRMEALKNPQNMESDAAIGARWMISNQNY